MMQRTGPERGGAALAVTSVASVQFGAALAATLFPLVGPVGTVSLRLVGAAMALLALNRPWRLRWPARDLRAAAVFGLVFVVMNVSLYTAVSRLPLATAVTLEFLGPLGVAVATATSWRQRGWALPAAAGVALLGGSLRAGDLIGVLAALTAALAWAAYILLSRKMGGSEKGLAGLCVAGVIGAVLMLPVGLVTAGTALLHPRTLALGLIVGVVSSAIPYSLDLLALRRLPTAVFGVLTSLNPAVAALAGLVVLGQHLPARQLAGIALVICASVGVTLPGGHGRSRPADIGDDRFAGVTDREIDSRAGGESERGAGDFFRVRCRGSDQRAGSIAMEPRFRGDRALHPARRSYSPPALLDDCRVSRRNPPNRYDGKTAGSKNGRPAGGSGGAGGAGGKTAGRRADPGAQGLRVQVGQGMAELVPDPDRPESWTLVVEGTPQSHVDLLDPTHLDFEYVRWLGHLVDLTPGSAPASEPPGAGERPGAGGPLRTGEPLNVLHLGGGAWTLARYVAATRPGSRQRVVELDAALIELVRTRLPARDTGIRVRAGDAREVLAGLTADSVDLIVVDVFSGARIPAHLTSTEFVAQAARVLRPDGSYAANVADGAPLAFARSQLATVATVFPETALIGSAQVLRGRRFENLVLLGSRRPLPVEDLARRTAGDPFPARVVSGPDVDRFVAGARTVTDATAGPSPLPPPDLMG